MMELFDGRYEKLEHLGSGAFAEVWKVRDVETDVVEALKIYTTRAGIDNDSVKLFTHEFSLLANANHPNLVKPLHFAISKPEGFPYLRMKYCNNGSMKGKMGLLSEEEVWLLIRDIAGALDYLHKMDPPVVHQDIKPENILKDDDRYMLSDFGVSTRVKSSLSRYSVMSDTLKVAGTTDYMAPERFSKNNTPIKANDIWSLGATVYELLTKEPPFIMGGLTQFKGAEIPELFGPFSPMLKLVVQDCLILEPWNRPRADQLFDIAQKMLDNQPVPDPLPWKNETKDEQVIPPLPPGGNNKKEKEKNNRNGNQGYTNDPQYWPKPPEPIPVSGRFSMVYAVLIAIVGLCVGVVLALI